MWPSADLKCFELVQNISTYIPIDAEFYADFKNVLLSFRIITFSMPKFFKGELRYGNLNTLVFVDSEYFEYL